VRGIASKYISQYDRLHLNLDLEVNSFPEDNERSIIPGMILGYSRPLGYPERFDRTFLAEVGVKAAEDQDSGAGVLLGVGIRQQIQVSGIIYLGLEGNIITGKGEERSQLRLITGYALSF
jgi:hypothetical protein